VVLSKFVKYARLNTWADTSAHAPHLAAVTQEAAISFPTGTNPTGSPLDPDGMGRLSFSLALFLDFPNYFCAASNRFNCPSALPFILIVLSFSLL
jgi:hypothetical protein